MRTTQQNFRKLMCTNIFVSMHNLKKEIGVTAETVGTTIMFLNKK